MALSATIFKIHLNLSNLNTHFYHDFNLTVAMHPSENHSRMMFRLLAFIVCADERLEFTKGLSDSDLPELWIKDYSGDIEHWVDLGQVDEKKIRQALGKSKKVSIFTYHGKKSIEWFEKNKEIMKEKGKGKLSVFHLKEMDDESIEALVQKNMDLSCTIEDDIIYLSDDNQRVGVQVISRGQF